MCNALAMREVFIITSTFSRVGDDADAMLYISYYIMVKIFTVLLLSFLHNLSF